MEKYTVILRSNGEILGEVYRGNSIRLAQSTVRKIVRNSIIPIDGGQLFVNKDGKLSVLMNYEDGVWMGTPITK